MNNIDLFRQIRSLLIDSPIPEELYKEAYNSNEWFDRENIDSSLSALIEGLLSEQGIVDFLTKYRSIEFNGDNDRSVAIIMAGNIPFVGAADILYALASSYNHIYLKYSSKDRVTMLWFVEIIEKALKNCGYNNIIITPYTSQKVDRAITTGSDNSSRYFRHLFAHCKTLIRSSRSSVALIKDGCSNKLIESLWYDLFLRYGQGCRNVTQLFIPQNFDVNNLIRIWRSKKIENPHFLNVYRQHKAIATMQKMEFIDLGYAIIVENSSLFPPLSQINITRYQDVEEFDKFTNSNYDKLQCVINSSSQYGEAQYPTLFDFADSIDVMEFLG